MQWSRQWVP